MCDPVIFHGITSELWASIETRVRAAGIDVEHDQGTAIIGPVDLRWDYEPDTQDLIVQCMSKPFLVTCHAVNDKIIDLFRQVRQSVM